MVGQCYGVQGAVSINMRPVCQIIGCSSSQGKKFSSLHINGFKNSPQYGKDIIIKHKDFKLTFIKISR